VPPVNVREDAVDDALAVLRAGAATVEPLVLRLGPAATFHPRSPVLYLEVGGDVTGLHRLRDAVFVAPLARRLTWPFVPHATLAEEMTPERLAGGVAALADFALDVRFDRVHLLEERRDPDLGRVWEPVADAPLAPVAVVGRGGLPTELVVSVTTDPAARALLAGGPLTVTARRDGRVVGVARAWFGCGDEGRLEEIAVLDGERRTGVGTQLLAALEAAAAARGATRLVADPAASGPGVGGFLEGRGWRPERSSSLVRAIFEKRD
jgi:2'-5' RNA ligase